MPGLKRHGITIKNSTSSTSGSLEGAHIMKDPSHPGTVRISYRPQLELLQSLLKSNHALQFSVKYDVDRSFDKGEGEIQVRADPIMKFRENCYVGSRGSPAKRRAQIFFFVLQILTLLNQNCHYKTLKCDVYCKDLERNF